MTADVAPALSELRSALGDGSVLAADDGGLERFTVPTRGTPGTALAVVRPGDVEQVRAAVVWARRHRVRLIPQGANTGLVGASTPTDRAAEVVLSLERLNRPPSIDPDDRSAVVESGVRLSTLNDAAAQHGLFLPIDLGADPAIGGMVATNTGGARMLRYGDMRRHVLGVEAVIADETASVVGELTSLRKNNTGPSVDQLLIGSSGSLGIITRAVVELAVVPRSRACAWLAPSDADSAIAALVLLERRFGRWLSAFEVVSAEALAAATSLPGSHSSPFGSALHPLVALLEFSSDADDADSAEQLVHALAAIHDAGLLSDAVVVPPEHAWGVRHTISEGLSRQGVVVGLDVSVPRSRLGEFRDAARAAVARQHPDVIIADFGHWGDGGVHCNLVFPDDPKPSEDVVGSARELVVDLVVERFGGSFSAEHGIGPATAGWWRASTPQATQGLLRAIKSYVDPLDVLGHPGLPY